VNAPALPAETSNIVSVRPSSWADLFDCAYRWEGKNILGMRSPAGPRMHLGTSLHASTAAFDQSRIFGAGISVGDSADVFVDALHHPKEEVDWKRDDFAIEDAESIGLALHGKYCTELSPRYEYKAVELRIEHLDIEVPEQSITIRVSGTMDRSRVRRGVTGGITVADLKSGVNAVGTDGKAATKGHWMQLGLYELGAVHALQEQIAGPAEIIGMQTTKKARVGVGEVRNAQRGLIGTPEQPGLIQMAAVMLKTGLFPPNPKSMTCGPKYCPRWNTCPYHE
jgi:hypothetical protein